jgi:hypothetical protein
MKILTVHYKTPDLIYRQYESIRQFYPLINYEVIDGSDDGNHYFEDLEKKDDNFKIKRFGYNIHHGPGMNYGIINSEVNEIIILDSDVWLKKDFLDIFLKNFNGIAKGMKLLINDEGISSTQKNRTSNNNFKYPYIHPYCMLVNKTEYLKYKPFVKHGAPCIEFMVDVYNNDKSDLLIDFPIEEYVNLEIRGTRSRWGINL